MDFIVHIFLFLVSAGIVWFFAGLLIESINNVAQRFHQNGFTVAFFVLGILTSISEISVMINSTLNGTPQVSAGNLVGASFVILLGIIPAMAIVGNGIRLKNTLHKRNLAIALFAVILPALFMLDGGVSVAEGSICLLVYITLAYFVRKQHSPTIPKLIEAVEEELIDTKQTTASDIIKIIVGAVLIFIAGHFLVDETIYFSNALGVPSSIIGLLVLSIGTNIPELVIAIRAILKKRTDIAFGDYLGSSVSNTAIFGFLPLLNGKFAVEPSEFIITAILMVIGLIGFYIFANSKNKISKDEGIMLIVVYGLFVLIQAITLLQFAAD